MTWPLASIGRAIQNLNDGNKRNIPRLDFLVSSKNKGASSLIGSKYFLQEGEKELTPEIIDSEFKKIRDYKEWNKVLKELLP